MIDAEDEALIDTRSSCTREQAVIKLLGWMRGPVLKRVIRLVDGVIPDSELPHYRFSDESLDEFLTERRERASIAFHNSVASGTYSQADLVALEDEVGKCDALIEKAAIYHRDIADDLADTATGTLRVDADETARHGTLHITLNSLDRWARKKYGISIYDTLTSHESKDDLNYTPTVEVDPDEGGDVSSPKSSDDLGPVKSRNLIRTLKLLLSAFEGKPPLDVQVPELDSGGGLSAIKAEQVYLLIARLAVEFSRTATKYQRGDNPNEKIIAERLVSKAQEDGIGFESIRKTLQHARAVAKRVNAKPST